MESSTEQLRTYGYDIVINRFEPLLRTAIINHSILPISGLSEWKASIPKGVWDDLNAQKSNTTQLLDIELLFEELNLLHLKDIAVFGNNYSFLSILMGPMTKPEFIGIMDDLNQLRIKIAHAKSNFTRLDFEESIDFIKELCQGELGQGLIKYIDDETYKGATAPQNLLEYDIPNNLPGEDFDVEGGFVGRSTEKTTIKKYLYSEQDRIVTILGAGGAGKTAIALKIAYEILRDANSPFYSILWFSAKTSRLTPEGLVRVEPDVVNLKQLTEDMLDVLDPKTAATFRETNIPYQHYIEKIYSILKNQKALVIIDNLETILADEELIDFITNIPRPSQLLVTSRKGLRKLERPFALPDLRTSDARKLFRFICKDRGRIDLLHLTEASIDTLVNRVRCFPLLIKWSIGRVCMGRNIDEAFAEINDGGSEIAKFSFNDSYGLLAKESISTLFAMIVYGERAISKHHLIHLTNFNDDVVDECINELLAVSFIIAAVEETENTRKTVYAMLSLTRGFVQSKLDADQIMRDIIQNRFFELSRDIQLTEKSRFEYSQSLASLGINSEDDKIAFTYVQSAKMYAKGGNVDAAKESFDKALGASPNFGYGLGEYAKFESDLKHFPKSNALFEQAIKHNPKNFHLFFDYAKNLRIQENLVASKQYLEKTLSIAPDHLPAQNELGRILTFQAEYEEANKCFEKSKVSRREPNNRHLMMTLQYQADCFKRWAEACRQRKDFNGSMEKLHKALSYIEEARKIVPGDIVLAITEKKICTTLAYELSESGRYEDAIPYYKRSLAQILLRNGLPLLNDDETAYAYYLYAKASMKFKKLPVAEIESLIRRGLAIAKRETHVSKLQVLLSRIETQPKKDLKFGIISSIVNDTYGFINSEGMSFFFLFSSIKSKPQQDRTTIGRTISFLLTDNPKHPDKKMASDIEFLD